MTTTSKEHRQRRYRMAVAYLNRRKTPGIWRGTQKEVDAFHEWVDAFPKFMVIAHPGKKLNTHDQHTIRPGDHKEARARATPVHNAAAGHGRAMRKARDARSTLPRPARLGL